MCRATKVFEISNPQTVGITCMSSVFACPSGKHSRLAASITEPNTPEIPTGNSALKKEAPSAKLWSSRHYCSTDPCTHKGVRKHFNNVCFNAVYRAVVYGAARFVFQLVLGEETYTCSHAHALQETYTET